MVQHKLRKRTVAVALLAGLASTATAQRFSWNADDTVGSGTGRGGEFVDRGLEGGRVAASARFKGAGSVGAFSEVALDLLNLQGGHKLSCIAGRTSACLPWYPEFSGPVAVIGAFAQPWSRTELRAGVGGGAYEPGNGPRVGAFVAQVDGAVFPIHHVGLVLGVRHILVPSYRHERLTITPWMVGLRVR